MAKRKQRAEARPQQVVSFGFRFWGTKLYTTFPFLKREIISQNGKYWRSPCRFVLLCRNSRSRIPRNNAARDGVVLMTIARLVMSISLATGTLLPIRSAAQGKHVDWDSCHDELEHARKAAAEASDAAEDVHSKFRDLDQCREDPDTYDLLHDDCRSRRSSYESAADDARSKLDDLDTRLHSVQTECGYQFTLSLSAEEVAKRHLDSSQHRLDSANQRLCESYRNFTPTIGLRNVLQICRRDKPDDWCTACLGVAPAKR